MSKIKTIAFVISLVGIIIGVIYGINKWKEHIANEAIRAYAAQIQTTPTTTIIDTVVQTSAPVLKVIRDPKQGVRIDSLLAELNGINQSLEEKEEFIRNLMWQKISGEQPFVVGSGKVVVFGNVVTLYDPLAKDEDPWKFQSDVRIDSVQGSVTVLPPDTVYQPMPKSFFGEAGIETGIRADFKTPLHPVWDGAGVFATLNFDQRFALVPKVKVTTVESKARMFYYANIKYVF